ncbi:MAG: glycosyltransferase family 2 protein [Eubacteriales bacterium]|nr:glycosyltransferase family 2 protein [Eubacteriales bacterium]
MKLISIVASVYNEEQGIRQFYTVVREKLEELKSKSGKMFEYEIFFVNDGSTDRSREILEEIWSRDKEHVSLLNFSKNFGHEAAMTAGLDYAKGDYLIFMDADLQHPPSCIADIMKAFEDGYEIISMVRTKNESAGLLKNITSSGFYKVINSLSQMHLEPAASDFFAISKKPAEVLRKNFRERVRFLRGYVQNIGFKKMNLEYEAAERVAGQSHYSLKKLWKFSMETIICFSNVPLKLGIYAGLMSALAGVILIIYTLLTKSGAPSGYATIVIALCFMFAVQFIIIGVIGEYIAVIFSELKDRPIYIVEDIKNINDKSDD